MSTGFALITSVVLLALNGFFVAAEFALVASKRYRLEQAAAGGGRGARGARPGGRGLGRVVGGGPRGHHQGPRGRG
ncbi:CNNM domain-containing protein, partial [Micromonospora palythoicola]|uniref:CNNM domain-containing protein n=1 Tax=Micromonospora palythoicola TaxID=3120507 RepID=UPI002FCE46DD